MHPITDSERLPLRVGDALDALMGPGAASAELVVGSPDGLPACTCALPRPAQAGASLRVSVRSNAGIPLATAVVDLRAGDRAIVTPPLTLLAMEGYAHLKPADRLAVQQRVWSRRAFVTIERA